jgi:hypothetical protein
MIQNDGKHRRFWGNSLDVSKFSLHQLTRHVCRVPIVSVLIARGHTCCRTASSLPEDALVELVLDAPGRGDRRLLYCHAFLTGSVKGTSTRSARRRAVACMTHSSEEGKRCFSSSLNSSFLGGRSPPQCTPSSARRMPTYHRTPTTRGSARKMAPINQ